MNKLIVTKVSRGIFFLLIIVSIGSCSKESKNYDIEGDSVNRIFFNTQTSIVNNLDFQIVHTPVNSMGDVTAKFPVKSTLKSNSDIEVSVEMDGTLLEEFNEENGTSYEAVPGEMVVISNNNLRIPKGAMISVDSLEIGVPSENLGGLNAPGYVIPLKITKISATENAAISSNLSTVFLVINTSNTNLYDSPGASDMVGSIVTNRSGWSAELDVPVNSGTLSAMFDGNTRSYWFISPSSECELTVDLGEEYENVTGLRIHPYSSTYSLLSASVASSLDGNDWVDQGDAQFASSSSYQYVKFYAPIKSRYFKINITGWRSSSNIVISEFDIYTE